MCKPAMTCLHGCRTGVQTDASRKPVDWHDSACPAHYDPWRLSGWADALDAQPSLVSCPSHLGSATRHASWLNASLALEEPEGSCLQDGRVGSVRCQARASACCGKQAGHPSGRCFSFALHCVCWVCIPSTPQLPTAADLHVFCLTYLPEAIVLAVAEHPARQA